MMSGLLQCLAGGTSTYDVVFMQNIPNPFIDRSLGMPKDVWLLKRKSKTTCLRVLLERSQLLVLLMLMLMPMLMLWRLWRLNLVLMTHRRSHSCYYSECAVDSLLLMPC